MEQILVEWLLHCWQWLISKPNTPLLTWELIYLGIVNAAAYSIPVLKHISTSSSRIMESRMLRMAKQSRLKINGKATRTREARVFWHLPKQSEIWLSHPGKIWPRHCKKVRWDLRDGAQYFTKKQRKAWASGFALVGLLQAEVLAWSPVVRPSMQTFPGFLWTGPRSSLQ